MDREITSVHNSVMKRKRSQRQCSSGATWSSSEDGTGDGWPTTTTTSSTTEEEEDREVAKCLILLARGQYRINRNSPGTLSTEMLQSRKSRLERTIDVGQYECKTCDRSFHSFQALGGHRTSHKKLKVTNEEHKSSSENRCHILPPIPSPQLGNSRAAASKIIRVHECLICGSEFPSGQALGGHMRKHRLILAVNSSSGTPTSQTDTKSDAVTLSMPSPAHCLDLNLPAASSSEDEIGSTKSSFNSTQPKKLQDSGFVFSTPALVDCHY
ncbi:hypothetical protein QQ045_030978 [Rhodiola kirilowii]